MSGVEEYVLMGEYLLIVEYLFIHGTVGTMFNAGDIEIARLGELGRSGIEGWAYV